MLHCIKTKTGDLIIEPMGNNTIDYRAVNLKANSTEVSSAKEFKSKKYFKWLASTFFNSLGT